MGCLQRGAVCGLCDFAKGTVGLCVKIFSKGFLVLSNLLVVHVTCDSQKMLLCYYMHGQCTGDYYLVLT